MSENADHIIFQRFNSNDLVEGILAGESIPSCVSVNDSTYTYRPTGEKECWLCTIKHLGAAWEYASEVQSHPHHFIKCVGALVAASRECPSADGRTRIREYYNNAIDTHCLEDMNPLLQFIYDLFEKEQP